MISRRSGHMPSVIVAALHLIAVSAVAAGPLDPRGKTHIPIGVPNTLDTLKDIRGRPRATSLPASAATGSTSGSTTTPKKTLCPDDGRREGGARPPRRGLLIPWTEWDARGLRVRSEVAHVKRAFAALRTRACQLP